MSAASNFIDAAYQNKTQEMVEAFKQAITENLNDIFVRASNRVSRNLVTKAGINEAVNFVIESVEKNGFEFLNASIVEASERYDVSQKELETLFAEQVELDEKAAINEATVTEPSADEMFISGLQKIVEENKSRQFQFADGSSAAITAREAKSLLEVYDSLNDVNQGHYIKMGISSAKEYFRLLQFAETVKE